MLVLRRKVGESIVLDGNINICVLAVHGERVKIGVTAPSNVTIVRQELLTRQTEIQENETPPDTYSSSSPANEVTVL